MKKKKLPLRLCSFIMAGIMLACNAYTYAVPAAAVTDKQQQLEEEKRKAQKELDNIKNEIQAHKENVANAQKQKEALQTQSNLITQQIGILVEQIADTEFQVQEKQREVAQKQEEIDNRWDDFKERMAAMQEINDRGGIAILSQATNLYELLTFNQTLQDISEKDNQILSQMEQAREELSAQQVALEEEQMRLESQRDQLNGKKTELVQNIQQTDATITAEQAEQKAAEAAAAQARKQLDAAVAALDSYIRSQNSGITGVYFNSSLGFSSPLPSFKYVTCLYGDGGHKGVDWAAAGGTPIYAAADGRVTIAENHWSYGNYVTVYHGEDNDGNTYATLYAHMIAAPSVIKGENVKKGQLLGYVGSTGNSTGNHLHLELRVNGNRTNPEYYIPRPGVVKYT